MSLLAAAGAAHAPGSGAVDHFPVTWTTLVNVTVTGVDNDLIKQSGGDGLWSGGARSVETITGDGYLQFTITDHLTTDRICGLCNADTNAADAFYADANYGAYPNGVGVLQVIELGAIKGSFGAYALNDIIKVERIGTTVTYAKNGVVFYTSLTASSGPLFIDASFFNVNAVIRQVHLVDNA